MKVTVVTGVSSFVGRHLAREFAQKGWTVTATLSKPLDSYEGIQAERLKRIGESIFWQELDLGTRRRSVTSSRASGLISGCITPDMPSTAAAARLDLQ